MTGNPLQSRAGTGHTCWIRGDEQDVADIRHALRLAGWCVKAPPGDGDFGHPPHVVLVATSMAGLAEIRDLSWSLASVPILVLLRSIDDEALGACFRAGAASVMPWSVGPDTVVRQMTMLAGSAAAFPHAAPPVLVDPLGVLTLQGRRVTLSLGEYRVARRLQQSPDRVVPYEELIAAAGYSELTPHRARRALNMMVSRLRRKIGASPEVRIMAVTNRGYILWTARIPPPHTAEERSRRRESLEAPRLVAPS